MLRRLYDDVEGTKDVTFILDSGSHVYAHRCVLLASGSTFFQRLLDPNSGFREVNLKKVLIRDCSDDEFKFVMKSIYEIEADYGHYEKSLTYYGPPPSYHPSDFKIPIESIFRLSAQFDTQFTLTQIFQRFKRSGNYDFVHHAVSYRPLFDHLVSSLDIDAHSLLQDIAGYPDKMKNKSYGRHEVLAYLIEVKPPDTTYGARLRRWMCSRAWSKDNISDDDRLILTAVLKRWDLDEYIADTCTYKDGVNCPQLQRTMHKMGELGLLDKTECEKFLEYGKQGVCYVIRLYPLQVGRKYKFPLQDKDEEKPTSEFLCYLDWRSKPTKEEKDIVYIVYK